VTDDDLARKRMQRLIERSSLGSAPARAMRATVAPEVAARVVARAAELDDDDDDDGQP
jgi:hypothetical protein